MECNICNEKFTSATRKALKCPKCEKDACKSCVRGNIKANEQSGVFCVYCKHEWMDVDLLTEAFGKTFVAVDYKKMREKRLLDAEVALLPETQLVIERERKIQEVRDVVDKLNRACRDADRVVLDLKHKKRYKKKEEKKLIDLDIAEAVVKQRAASDILRLARDNLYDLMINDDTAVEQRRQFVRGCPAEGCRGFLSTQWKCGLCDVDVCKDCNIIKTGDSHTCKQEDVDTVKMLRKDSKPCPKCACLIFKIDGCDQMWCTMCHTAFSWARGTIETKIHNPHYYEWLRKTKGSVPRELGDGGCAQVVDEFEQAINNIERVQIYWSRKNKNMDVVKRLYSLHMFIRHIQDVELMSERVDNKDLRVKYLKGEYSKEKLAQHVQRRDKKISSNRDVNNLFRTFALGVSQFVSSLDNSKTYTLLYIHKGIVELLDFVNNQMELSAKKYNYSVYKKICVMGDKTNMTRVFEVDTVKLV